MPGIRYTTRERQILRLIATDCSDKQAASHLGISRHTLRSHVDRMFQRHGFHSRAAAVAAWICQSYGVVLPLDDVVVEKFLAPEAPEVQLDLLHPLQQRGQV
jgi:DNA-binding CsgD family transcriptional regulator